MTMSRTVRRYRGWIAAGALIAIAVIAYTMLQQSSTDEAVVTYETEAAALGTISVTVSGTGNLEIDGTTDVYASSSGTVDSVAVAEGDAVTTGTVLFTLDAQDAESNTAKNYSSYLQTKQGVYSAETQLIRAQNSLENLEATYEEQEDATSAASTADTNTTSAPSAAAEVTQDDLDLAERDVESAQMNVTAAKVSLSAALDSYEQAKAAQEDLKVYSPGSGYVYSLGIESGDAVTGSDAGSATGGTTGATASSSSSSSDAPVVIAPEQPLALHLTVNEVDVPAIEVGQRADIEFDALSDLTATGKVYEISAEGTNEQGVVTFDVWLSVDVLDARLRAGMSSAASIVTDFERDSLLVPNGAIKADSDGSYYVEVMAEGATEPRRVTIETGLSNATQTQVLSGLSEGDLIVTQTVDSGTAQDTESGGGIMIPGMGGGGGPRG